MPTLLRSLAVFLSILATVLLVRARTGGAERYPDQLRALARERAGHPDDFRDATTLPGFTALPDEAQQQGTLVCREKRRVPRDEAAAINGACLNGDAELLEEWIAERTRRRPWAFGLLGGAVLLLGTSFLKRR